MQNQSKRSELNLKISKGICLDNEINDVRLIRKLQSLENYNYNETIGNRTIILCSGISYKANFYVSDKEFIQNLPLTGSKIIIAFSDKGDFNTIRNNAIKIICAFMREFDIPIENVFSYRALSEEEFLNPRQILKSEENWKSNWCFFRFLVMKEYEQLYN